MDAILFNNCNDDSSFAHWHQQPVEILGVIADMNDRSILDAEAMPQFQVKLLSTGEINTAHVDEIDEAHWTGDMQAVLAGMAAYREGSRHNPYSCLSQVDQHLCFERGLVLAEFKEAC